MWNLLYFFLTLLKKFILIQSIINKSVKVPLCHRSTWEEPCAIQLVTVWTMSHLIPAREHTFHIVPLHWLLPKPDDHSPLSPKQAQNSWFRHCRICTPLKSQVNHEKNKTPADGMLSSLEKPLQALLGLFAQLHHFDSAGDTRETTAPNAGTYFKLK